MTVEIRLSVPDDLYLLYVKAAKKENKSVQDWILNRLIKLPVNYASPQRVPLKPVFKRPD